MWSKVLTNGFFSYTSRHYSGKCFHRVQEMMWQESSLHPLSLPQRQTRLPVISFYRETQSEQHFFKVIQHKWFHLYSNFEFYLKPLSHKQGIIEFLEELIMLREKMSLPTFHQADWLLAEEVFMLSHLLCQKLFKVFIMQLLDLLYHEELMQNCVWFLKMQPNFEQHSLKERSISCL